jgi:hypothetical protein
MIAKEKWGILKNVVGNYSAKVYCDAKGPCTGEFKAGFDRALGWVDHKIYFLETMESDTKGLIDIVPSLVHDFVYGSGTINDLHRAIEILENSIDDAEKENEEEEP